MRDGDNMPQIIKIFTKPQACNAGGRGNLDNSVG